MTDAELEIAYHEAGHAVVALVLGIKVKSASVEKKDDTLGRVTTIGITVAAPEAQIKFYLAGAAAASMAGLIGEAVDREVGSYSDVAYVVPLIESVDEIPAYMQKTQALLDEHWPLVDFIANALLRHRTLSGAQLGEMVANEQVAIYERLLERCSAIRAQIADQRGPSAHYVPFRPD